MGHLFSVPLHAVDDIVCILIVMFHVSIFEIPTSHYSSVEWLTECFFYEQFTGAVSSLHVHQMFL